MLLAYKEENHLYLVFQDFVYKEEEILKEISSFPKNAIKCIESFLKENFFASSLKKQKNYLNSISTYIDVISEKDEQYYFTLFVLPKDLDIKYDSSKQPKLLFKEVEKLSLELFKLYSSLNIFSDKRIELLKHFKGDSFLQLEIDFYIKNLEKLSNYLMNYKIHQRKTIICSDKSVGIDIDYLNSIEQNPLKKYQFIKTPFQKDLLIFVSSIIKFLIKYRFSNFESTKQSSFNQLLKLTKKIKNQLLKISRNKSIHSKDIKKTKIREFLNKNKNKKEIIDNKKIYKIIESIIFTQLDDDAQFFLSIDLTKVNEVIIEKRLNQYQENLYIGNDSARSIIYAKDQSKDSKLNSINKLMKYSKKELKQYPDFMIEENHASYKIYHIIDAKYKLIENIPNESDTRQILIYSILFNKDFLINLDNQRFIKKIIIYTTKSEVSLDNITNLNFSLNNIDINKYTFKEEENIFDSNIQFIGINLLK